MLVKLLFEINADKHTLGYPLTALPAAELNSYYPIILTL